ncbi:MAG: DedA family protein [Gemmatimonadota bacterium]
MLAELEKLIGLISRIPVETIYLLIAAGAAIENVFPPIPSDVIVLAGAILADRGVLRPDAVFFVAWAGNITLSLAVYFAARSYGAGLFATRWGRWLLRPRQLERMAVFYDQYGTLTVLVSRFFPVFRVLVPAFAGVSRLGFWRTAIPLTIASAVWYGALVATGVLLSRNLPRLVEAVQAANATVAGIALLVAGLITFVWWRTRRHDDEGGSVDGPPGSDGDAADAPAGES